MKKMIRMVGIFTAMVVSAGVARAAEYTWTPTAAGTYEWTGGNWTSGYPNAEDDVANFNINIAGAQTINLGQVITLGELKLGDTASSWFGVTIAPGTDPGVGSLIMQASVGDALLTKVASGNTATDTISANMLLNSNLAANIANGTVLISGNLSGTGLLTKSGAGTLQLQGANTHSGGVTLSAGTLNLRNAEALGSGTFTINGGTLGDGNTTFTSSTNNAIILNGNFAKVDTVGRTMNMGSGAVTLNQAITITISAHPIQFDGAITGPGGLNALDITPSGTNNSQVILGAGITLRGTQTVTTIGSAGRLVLNGILSDGGNGYGLIVNGSGGAGGVTLGNVTHTFTGPVTLQNNGGMVILGNIAPSSITVNSGSTLQLGDGDGGTTGSITPATTLENNGTFRLGVNRTLVQGVDFPSLITGTGGLTRGNHGTIVLNAQNTFTGSVTVSGNSGGFAVGADSVGTVGNITSGPLGRGTLVLNSQSVFSDGTTARTILNPVTVGGNASLGHATNNGKLTFEDTITLTGDRTLTVNSAVDANKGISASTHTLSKAGAGTLALNGATSLRNLNVGNQVTGGTLTVGSGGTLSVGSGTGHSITVGNSGGTAGGSGTLDVSTSTKFTANVGNFIVGDSSRGQGGGGMNGYIYLGTDNEITATAFYIGRTTTDNPTGGSGKLTTANSGSTTIHASNLYVQYGEGKVLSEFTLGSGASLTLRGQSGGSSRAGLTIGSTPYGYGPVAGTMDLSAGEAKLYLNQLVVGKTTGTHANARTITGTLNMSTSASNHLDISGSGTVVTIGSSSTGAGGVGTITIGNLDATSSITTTSDTAAAIVLGHKGSTGAATGTLNLNGGTLTITTGGGAAIAGGGGTGRLYLDGGVKLIAGATNANWIQGLTTAEIKSGGATIDTDGKDIGISQAFSGAGGLIKDGAGKLTLSGSSSHASTTIQAGTLELTETGTLSGEVVVGAAGILSGEGTIGGSLTFVAGSRLVFNSVAPLTVNGASVSFGGFSIANLLGLDGNAVIEDTYTLITGTAEINWANVSNVGVSNAASIGGGKSAYFQSGSLQLVVIPEPATFGIVLSVLAAAIIRRKRFG